VCERGGGPSGTRGAAGRRLRRPLGSRRRLRPQASRYIPGSSPSAPKATFGSVPCACVLASPLYYEPSVKEPIILVLLHPIRTTHTTAIRLRDFCAIYDLPSTHRVYAVHHTILVMATQLWFESHGGRKPGASRSRRAVWVIAPSSLFR